MLLNWIKIAIRNSKKNAFFTFINIFGLTIGMVSLIFTILYWNEESSVNQWNPYKDEVYFSASINENGKISGVSSILEGPKSKEIIPEIEDYLVFNNSGIQAGLLAHKDKSTYNENLLTASKKFFEFFPFTFIKGKAKGVIDDVNSIAISEKVATSFFGEKNPIGEKVRINDSKDYIVRGVYQLKKSSFMPEVVIPFNEKETDAFGGWGSKSHYLFYKLKKNADPSKVATLISNKVFREFITKPNAKEAGVSIEEYITSRGEDKSVLDRLGEIHLYGKSNALRGGNLKLLLILFGLSILILILSCINFINLSTAGAMKRAKEIGVRKTLGAQKKDIVLQFIIETTIICLVSLLFTLVIVEILTPSFNAFFDIKVSLFNNIVFGQIMIIFLIILIGSGLFPALYLSNFQPLKVLKGDFSRSRTGIKIRNTMLVFQFVISAFFIVSGLIIYLQVKYMNDKDLGFNADQVIRVNFKNRNDKNISQKYELLKAQLKGEKGIVNISSGFLSPGSSIQLNFGGIEFKDQSYGNASFIGIDYNYLELLDVKLKEGRMLSPNYASDSITSIIVNKAFVRKFDLKNPINHKIKANGTSLEIVGVIEDYFEKGFYKKIEPYMYYYYNNKAVSWFPINDVLFKLKKDNISSTIDKIEKFWTTNIEPKYPFDYTFLDKDFEKTYQEHKKQQVLFMILTFLVVFIALLGLFALTSYMIGQRLREVAIRKTLGASTSQLINTLTKQYLKLAGIAILLSMPISLYFTNYWLESFVYRIDMPWWPYVVTFIAMMTLAYAVVSTLALNAAKKEVIKYLKYE